MAGKRRRPRAPANGSRRGRTHDFVVCAPRAREGDWSGKKNERTQCETKVNLKLFFFFYFHFFFVSPVFVCNRCFFIFGFGWRASLAVVFVSVRNFFFCAFSGRLESVFDALFPSCVNPLKTKPSNCPPVFSSSFIAFLSLPQRKTRGESCPTGKRTRKSRPV